MNKRKQDKIIGILGGMGPQASAKLVQILVDLSAREFGAVNGEDFPEIMLNSIPVPDFISNKKNKNAVFKVLKQRVKQMNNIKVGLLAIACNTAHLLLDDLQKASKAPFLSMVNEVAKEVARCKISKVGILGSPTTIKTGLYQKAIESERLVWPERRVYSSY